jgi:hypothetical protein
MMRWDDHDGRGRFIAAAALRREASAERPPFSDRLHEQIVRRLPAARPPTHARRPIAAALAPPRLFNRTVITLAASAALVAVAALLVARPVRDADPARPLRPMNAGGAAVVALDAEASGELVVAAAALPDETPGIDRLPTPGEIEEELREGVTTLAVSLLEVPDWTSLADFDAGSFLGDAGR